MEIWSYLQGGRSNEVGSHYGSTSFKHVLHMNTFNSARNYPFTVIFQPYNRNSLQLNNQSPNKTEYMDPMQNTCWINSLLFKLKLASLEVMYSFEFCSE